MQKFSNGMSLFDLFFGKQKEQSAIAEITDELKSKLEPVLQSHFIDYQKKIGLLSRFENNQIKARDFTKRFKKLCKFPSRGNIGSFEKREIAKILSLLSSAIDTEQNPEIKDLEKK